MATAEPHATHVGLDVLKAGGNAVDAAVATAFALAVTYPSAGNIGGGGFMVVRLADGTTGALDFRETAPRRAGRSMYLGPDGKLTDRSLYGIEAAGVPGSVAGLWAAHQRFGSKPWAELIEPAAGLAADGFEVSEALRESGERLARALDEHGQGPAFGATRASFGVLADPVTERFVQPELAETLRRIARDGPDEFYAGETAERIVAAMQAYGGFMTARDLAAYTAIWREPLQFTYRDHVLIGMPPVSSGAVTMAQIANILEGYDLPSLPFDSDLRIHLYAEAFRRAYADRNALLGDPDFVKNPVELLMSKSYADGRRASIDTEHASLSTDVGPGAPAARGRGSNTTHFSIVDGDGNAVAMTTTLNTSYGSLVTVPGAGFVLNNEMDDFAADPGKPNAYGLVQGEANAIVGGKRMLSSMSPTIVLDPDGDLFMVSGTPGGSRIITVTFQSIANVIDHGMDVAAAVSAPRMHHQHLPDTLWYEAGWSDETLKGLAARGHALTERDPFCNVQAIVVLPDGTLMGASDPRESGLTLGY